MHQLQNILRKVSGASFIAIDTLTKVPLKGGKGNPFQGRVTKAHVGASVMVFQNKNGSAYERMIHRRLEQEGKDPKTFTLSPRKWGARIPNTPFIEHENKLYLEVIFLKPGITTYLVDGLPYTGEIPGLVKEIEPTGQGGLENQVIVRTYHCESIVHVRVNKMEYILTSAVATA